MIVNNKKHKDFFVQTVEVDKFYKDKSRTEFFLPFIKNKKVLHLGFVDWPLKSSKNSLHFWLSENCQLIDGFDVNREGAENLRVPNGDLFFDWNLIKDQYDVIMIPEVLEHVGNVEEFLKKLDRLSGMLIITVPDAYLLQHHFEERDKFIEVVHPDHNYYFTPYTLKNTIEKYSKRKVKSLHWIQNHSIAAICE